MIKRAIFLIMLLSFALISHAQIIDVTPKSEENYRFVEGGSQKVMIDKVTPVNVLIKRFEKPWHLVETGKAYWIGYTDDMYSIAAHSVYAIRPLISFIESTKNYQAKMGAVCTLHLIGINRKIAGRFSENFTDKNARNALLYLLKYNDIAEPIMRLLVRDPWQSDPPKLLKIIKEHGDDYWYIITALNHYNLPGFPLDGNISDKIGQITYTIPYKGSFSYDDFDLQFHQSLNAIKKLKRPNIHIENDLLKTSKLWGQVKQGMNEADRKNNHLELTLQEFLTTVTNNFYGEIGSKLHYYTKGDDLYMCAPKTARNIILNWWNNQPNSYKMQFTLDAKKKRPLNKILRLK